MSTINEVAIRTTGSAELSHCMLPCNAAKTLLPQSSLAWASNTSVYEGSERRLCYLLPLTELHTRCWLFRFCRKRITGRPKQAGPGSATLRIKGISLPVDDRQITFPQSFASTRNRADLYVCRPFISMLIKPFCTLSSVLLFTRISHGLSFGCGTAPDPDSEITTSDNATVLRRQDTGVRVTCELGSQGSVPLF